MCLKRKRKRKRKTPDQRSKESKRKIYRKVVGPENVCMMYGIVTSKKKQKKRNNELKHMKLPFLVINQILVPAPLSCRAKQKKGKRKGRNSTSQISHHNLVP